MWGKRLSAKEGVHMLMSRYYRSLRYEFGNKLAGYRKGLIYWGGSTLFIFGALGGVICILSLWMTEHFFASRLFTWTGINVPNDGYVSGLCAIIAALGILIGWLHEKAYNSTYKQIWGARERARALVGPW